ncbi:hypothetical protein B0I72DRAFT_140647 [Yarrowia lipolytica]|jgi:Zn-dependent metalloprotease|uniref:YALI0C19822p n=2 Tax=Yarrowia lipolytica TaxID=4952 RepID=Q6CBD4_YARLI|nr:YALI0C19822p [Yarrowia lipolytica CLIB122]AOW03110.1 hypothetical protein YALI1_C27182g [Yarrowia lipolytica]AOW03134.1 hypothetical protein YALI1_C27786g [Yarrowia lipolytica]KAB8279933.1 hypothetical protein BKA91DRAFT_170650 [Yarrowia lipolytica]KAE8168906.1 hypothetical protein BKA90DRAFT_171494 [Yarrowia lipolytica]KAJ8053643.1 hypothetical protein LXG23DRAFT_55224 [Yarrowia lipolytica]|eukprot:XP_502028.2 YALI0C19822p [Yarrowia lipolytica CLIB122]
MSDVESMHSAHSEEESFDHSKDEAPEHHEAAAAEEAPKPAEEDDDIVVKPERLSRDEWLNSLDATFHFGSKKHQSIPDDLKIPIAICCLPKDKRRFVMAKLAKCRRQVPVDEEEVKAPVEEKKEKKHAAGPE